MSEDGFIAPASSVPSTDFSRYLEAKKSLDDRSLNPRVWEAFRRSFPRPADVLDVGCGLGVTLERLLNAGLVQVGESSSVARYSGIDSDAALIRLAASRLSVRLGFAFKELADGEAAGGGAAFRGLAPGGSLNVSLRATALSRFAHKRRPGQSWNVIVAHAVFDLLDIDEALNALADLASPDALLYASLCFDDLTALDPPVEPALDDRIVAAYHRHMYAQQWGGGNGHARAGRGLLAALTHRGIEIVEAGPSDWVIVPRRGGYADNERFVLGFLLRHLGRVVMASGEFPAATVQAWVQTRLGQLERGELIYVAHQLDVLARIPAPP